MAKSQQKQYSLAQLLQELESISQNFEVSTGPQPQDLEDKIRLFERGMQIAQECKSRLAVLENTIQKVQEKYQS